tara:strand:+ start:130 stop:363 length:234 start_codon:yes stop_codon:yes gene_type:complete
MSKDNQETSNTPTAKALPSSSGSPYGEYEAINGAIANRLIKELENTRREAEEFRDDMNVHLTEGDGKFTWENGGTDT